MDANKHLQALYVNRLLIVVCTMMPTVSCVPRVTIRENGLKFDADRKHIVVERIRGDRHADWNTNDAQKEKRLHDDASEKRTSAEPSFERNGPGAKLPSLHLVRELGAVQHNLRSLDAKIGSLQKHIIEQRDPKRSLAARGEGKTGTSLTPNLRLQDGTVLTDENGLHAAIAPIPRPSTSSKATNEAVHAPFPVGPSNEEIQAPHTWDTRQASGTGKRTPFQSKHPAATREGPPPYAEEGERYALTSSATAAVLVAAFAITAVLLLRWRRRLPIVIGLDVRTGDESRSLRAVVERGEGISLTNKKVRAVPLAMLGEGPAIVVRRAYPVIEPAGEGFHVERGGESLVSRARLREGDVIRITGTDMDRTILISRIAPLRHWSSEDLIDGHDASKSRVGLQPAPV